MIKVFKEEEFEESDWSDVTQVVMTSLYWLVDNLEVSTDKLPNSTPVFKKSSQSKKKQRGD